MASARYETPKPTCLDFSIFEPGKELLLYRLVTSGRTQFDGLAAAKWAGRWNRVGQPTIYTSLAVATTIAEVLHYIETDEIPNGYVVMTIRFMVPQRVVAPFTKKRSRSTANPVDVQMRIFESIASAEIAFENPDPYETPFAVAVPSIRAPAWNVVLYPEAPGFWQHVALIKQESFNHSPNAYSS